MSRIHEQKKEDLLQKEKLESFKLVYANNNKKQKYKLKKKNFKALKKFPL